MNIVQIAQDGQLHALMMILLMQTNLSAPDTYALRYYLLGKKKSQRNYAIRQSYREPLGGLSRSTAHEIHQ